MKVWEVDTRGYSSVRFLLRSRKATVTPSWKRPSLAQSGLTTSLSLTETSQSLISLHMHAVSGTVTSAEGLGPSHTYDRISTSRHSSVELLSTGFGSIEFDNSISVVTC